LICDTLSFSFQFFFIRNYNNDAIGHFHLPALIFMKLILFKNGQFSWNRKLLISNQGFPDILFSRQFFGFVWMHLCSVLDYRLLNSVIVCAIGDGCRWINKEGNC
jgi:hypothetical protein